MSDWKNDRAEMAMREAGKKIMEEAAKGRAAEFKQICKWTITLKGNSELTEQEIEAFIDRLIDLSEQENANSQNIEVYLDPIIEE